MSENVRTTVSDAVTSRRAELATFLRIRRAELKPEDVGLRVPPGRRNTPGLRREEVAQVSGVGVTWYTWLEQGRSITASAHVIDALARAFRLDRENHCHLRHLAGLPTPEPDQMPEGATPELNRLLAALVPAPACLLGQRFDFVAWNETFAALWDPGGLPEGRRNLMWLAFADPFIDGGGSTGRAEVASCSRSSEPSPGGTPETPSSTNSSTRFVQPVQSSERCGVTTW